VRGILNEFLARHERKNAGGNALESLQRLLNSYAKPDGTIIPKDIIVALNDVMIGINMEQATKIAREVGTSLKNTVLVSALMHYLGDEMHQLQAARKRRATARPEPEGGVRTSLDDSRAITEAPRVSSSAVRSLLLLMYDSFLSHVVCSHRLCDQRDPPARRCVQAVRMQAAARV
jgi:hypothetical protein